MLQKDRFYFLENEQHEMLSKQVPTCLTALFHDHLSEITKLCDTFLQPFSKTPVMRHLGANMLLLNNIDSYQITLSANNSRTVYNNCSACIRTVPCGSRIQAGTLMTLIPNCPQSVRWEEADVQMHLPNLQVLGPLLDS
jgi:hypothetical protein